MNDSTPSPALRLSITRIVRKGDITGLLIAEVPCVILSLPLIINTRYVGFHNLYSSAKRCTVKIVLSVNRLSGTPG
jgi:hypothetical protein